MGRSIEEDMIDTAPALDEAFERMAAASFELPNGFVNHGGHGLRGAGHARLHRRHRQLGPPVRPAGGSCRPDRAILALALRRRHGRTALCTKFAPRHSVQVADL